MNSSKIKKTMNKISVIITTFLFIFTISTLIFNLIFNNIIVSKYCSEIQKQSVILKMDQSKKIFEFQLKTLNSVVQDYAIWDEIYNKIQEENIDKTWFDINYSKWLPEKLDIDLIIVANRNKEIILEYGLNGSIDTILNTDNISRLFNENTYKENIGFSGFKEYNGEIYLLGVCPIFRTTTEGTSQGVVILGKKITPTFLQTLQDQFGNNIFITYNDKFISTEDMAKELENNSLLIRKNENNLVYEFNNSYIIGSAPLIDICGSSIGYINIIHSTDIFSSTQKLIQRNILLFMIISSILLFLLSFKFKRIIVDPIKQLEKQIKLLTY